MASEDMSKKFENLKIQKSQDVNILLLGETGVGKSTFVNAIANYLHFKTFKKASKAEKLLVLIPSVITVTDDNLRQITIQIGSDDNEFQEIGAAGTQDVKTYVFPIGEGQTRLRLIDSPGMGDPRGIQQDDLNCENILRYLSQLSELHAICFLMKPTTTRKTVYFEYCVKQILSRLEKSASKNIIFIFTNTRGTDYTPGDTLPCLRTIIEDIKNKPPHVTIPLKDNIFSLDNEAFRLLVAVKQGVTFNESIQQKFIESWNNSAKECWRLISYIVGDAARDPLKPHQLKNTISINEARRIIVQLAQPLADISQLIHDNIRILERHQNNLKIENQSLNELKSKLYIPVMNLEVTKLTQPATVCTSSKCAQVMNVGELKKWHYPQRCHDPCYLTDVPKDIVGDSKLMNCAAMSGNICLKCTCNYQVHMHIYYMTKPVDGKIEDDIVRDTIVVKEQALTESRRLVQQIDSRKQELEEERLTIINSSAQFAHFLQHNAISPFNDSYEAYIDYLIVRERSLGQNGDPEVISSLENLLRQYKDIKLAFEKSLAHDKQHGIHTSGTSAITPETIMETIHHLYNLKHNGKKIHELLKKQQTSRKFEYDQSCEYIHPKTSDLKPREKKKDKKKGKESEGESKDKSKKQETKVENRPPPKRNYNNQGPRYPPYNRQQVRSDRHTFSDPPPPYEESSKGRHNYGGAHGKPHVEVKVSVTDPTKNRRQRSYQPEFGYNYGPNQQTHYPPNQSSYYGNPPQHVPYPHQAPYPGPPPSQHYTPPHHNDGPSYHGHHQQHYAGPYHNDGPSHYEHHQPHYAGPPQGEHFRPPHQNDGSAHYGRYQQHYSGPKQGYRGPQNRRGKDFKPRYDGKRHSNSRHRNSGKSDTDKRSKSSDSSSDS